MANSQYGYVKAYERPDLLLLSTWIVVRIDGRGFHKLCDKYNFRKPNDRQALDLMNAAAQGVMREVRELVVAYGHSDEYSFVFPPNTTLFERRESKLITTITSTFTSYYTHLWPTFFPDKPLSPPLPTFDGRAVLYPHVQILRDYLSWRQVDCLGHVNNTYNTTFWALVQQGGMSVQQAEDELKGTMFKDKNEILFSRFHINYNDEPEIFKKGSTVFREYDISPDTAVANIPGASQVSVEYAAPSKRQREKGHKARAKAQITVAYVDIIKDIFWEHHPGILAGYVSKTG